MVWKTEKNNIWENRPLNRGRLNALKATVASFFPVKSERSFALSVVLALAG
jgi:hypothetical protein